MTLRALFVLATSVALGSACRETGGNVVIRDLASGSSDLAGDMAGQPPPPDLSASAGDMAVVAVSTIHDLIANASNRQKVKVVEVVVTGVPRYNSTSGGGFCQYEAYVQDAAGMAPNGVRLYARGGMAVVRDGGSNFCPFPPMSGTALDTFADLGDVLTITGSWGIFAPATDGGLLPAQHELDISSGTVTKVRAGGTVTPVVITNTAPFVKNGMGFVSYENTLVTIKPAMPSVVSGYDNFGNYVFGGAQFRGDFRFVYNKVDGGTLPSNGQTWSQITGLALLPFGGGVAARTMNDFLP